MAYIKYLLDAAVANLEQRRNCNVVSMSRSVSSYLSECAFVIGSGNCAQCMQSKAAGAVLDTA